MSESPLEDDPSLPPPASAVPRRVIEDAQTLRALAHPVRIRLLEELAFGGAATATELADRVGESAANTSWHLRQLARYGYVEEAGGGTGRQRPWKVVVQSNSWKEGTADGPDAVIDPDTVVAANAALDVLVAREYEAMREWRARMHTESARWQAAASASQAMGWMTADELEEAGRKIQEIFEPFVHRISDPTTRPAGSRPVRGVAWAFPARPAPPDPPTA